MNMNLLELQQRANVLVEKANAYEDSLQGVTWNEQEIINQHKYTDIYSLRPIMKLLFGSSITEKTNRTLDNDVALRVFASTAPMWNSSFNLLSYNNPGGQQSVDYKSDQHEFMNDIHNYNNSNLITLDVKQNTLTDRSTRIKHGINYSYSANIQDALVTESQVANVFKWNTTFNQDIKNNSITTSRQVPGIVCYYLGNDYNGEYTATIPYNPGTMKLNQINYSTPPSYGAFYTTDPTTSQVPVRQGVLEEDIGHEACRIFIPGMHFTRGKLESPQQIWQPDMKFGDSNIGLGYNWQGQALYHELVFKNRRSGSKRANVDFIPTPDTVADNDPQGLATRFALAQQKKYYKNRPWFNELDELVDLDPTRLQKIIENNSYITSGSFDKSKFIMALPDYGTLSDDGILTSTSANGGYLYTQDILTNIILENNNSITILSPIYTVNQKSKDSNILSGNFTNGNYFGTYSIAFDAGNETATFRLGNGHSVEQSIQLFTSFNINDSFQFKITLSLNSGTLTGSIQYKVNSGNWIDKGSTELAVNSSLSLLSFTRIGGLPANTSDINPLSIVDQDDTVLFSAQDGASKTYMTDEQFYNQFKLDYDMFARAFNLPQ